MYIFVYHLYSWAAWVRLSLSVRTIMSSPSFGPLISTIWRSFFEWIISDWLERFERRRTIDDTVYKRSERKTGPKENRKRWRERVRATKERRKRKKGQVDCGENKRFGFIFSLLRFLFFFYCVFSRVFFIVIFFCFSS